MSLNAVTCQSLHVCRVVVQILDKKILWSQDPNAPIFFPKLVLNETYERKLHQAIQAQSPTPPNFKRLLLPESIPPSSPGSKTPNSSHQDQAANSRIRNIRRAPQLRHQPRRTPPTLHASTAFPNVVAPERVTMNGIKAWASMTVRWPSCVAVLRCRLSPRIRGRRRRIEMHRRGIGLR
jgi:hypothetical protein